MPNKIIIIRTFKIEKVIGSIVRTGSLSYRTVLIWQFWAAVQMKDSGIFRGRGGKGTATRHVHEVTIRLLRGHMTSRVM